MSSREQMHAYLLPREGRRRLSPDLGHPPLPDVDLFLRVEDRWLRVGWKI